MLRSTWASCFLLAFSLSTPIHLTDEGIADTHRSYNAHHKGTARLQNPGRIRALPSNFTHALTPAVSAIGTFYEFDIPGTNLIARLSTLHNARWLIKAFVAQLFESAAGELKLEPSVLVVDPDTFEASYRNHHLQIGRLRGVDDYPNLFYGDVRQALKVLYKTIGLYSLWTEVEMRLLWKNIEKTLVGKVRLSLNVPGAESGLEAVSLQNETTYSLRRRADLEESRNDDSFDVPNTPFRVMLLFDTFADVLDEEVVSQCFLEMRKQLKESDATTKIRKVSATFKGVELSLNKLPGAASNVSNVYYLTYGDAIQVLDALSTYLLEEDLYYTMLYQISYRAREFVAVGGLRPTRSQSALNVGYSQSLSPMNISDLGHGILPF